MAATRTGTKRSMTEEARLAKNAKIKAAGKATRERRAKMLVLTRELKITKSALSRQQREALARLFLEAKWLRNHALSESRFDVGFYMELSGNVPVVTPEGVDTRELKYCTGQRAQSVIRELDRNRKSLAALKRNGHKIGRLKFKSEVKSLDLPQHGVTYRLDSHKKKIKLAGLPGWMRARGWEQIPDGAEFANAKLVHRASGYYLIVTLYVENEPGATRQTQTFQPKTEVGVDFGVGSPFTLSDGTVLGSVVEESDRARRLAKKLSRQVKGSNSHRRTLQRLRRAREHDSNKRDDLANKILHELLNSETVYFQDENISGWKAGARKKRWGKKLHGGLLGRVKAGLKAHPRAVMIDRWMPTTRYCRECGGTTKHGLDETLFNCQYCGYTAPRDQHAALNMIFFGQQSPSSGTDEYSGGVVVRPAEVDQASQQPARAVKPETVTSLASP